MPTSVISVSGKDKSTYTYIGRNIQGGYKNSIFHNPYRVGKEGVNDANDAVYRYYKYITDYRRLDLQMQIPRLRDQVLGCWCKKKGGEICHGDVLVYLLEGTLTSKLRDVFIMGNIDFPANTPIVETDWPNNGVIMEYVSPVPRPLNQTRINKDKLSGMLLTAYLTDSIYNNGNIGSATELSLVVNRTLVSYACYNRRAVIDEYIGWTNSSVVSDNNFKTLFKTPKFDAYERRYLKHKGAAADAIFVVIPERDDLDSSLVMARLLGLACIEDNNDAIMVDVWSTNPSVITYWCVVIYLKCLRLALLDHDVADICNQITQLITDNPNIPEIIKVISTYTNSNVDLPNSIAKNLHRTILTSLYLALKFLYKRTRGCVSYKEVLSTTNNNVDAYIVSALFGAIDGYNNLIADPINYQHLIKLTGVNNSRTLYYQLADITILIESMLLLDSK